MFLEVKGLNSLKKKFATSYEGFKTHIISEINTMVTQVAYEASADAADLPYLSTNSSYERTGNLSRSIKAIPFNGKFAEIVVGNSLVDYGAYVEFGTGSGFGVPYRKYNMASKNITPYASLFRGRGLRNSNMPYRSYLFNNFEIGYTKALKQIRAFKMS
jgi:hypothetical protein